MHNRQLWLDCDGVLADFDLGGEKLWGMPPPEYEKKVGTAQFWYELEHQTDFFGNLPLMLGAKWLVQQCRDLGYHPKILTGIPRGDWAVRQKLSWGAKNFPGMEMIACPSEDKCKYGKPGDILVDDRVNYAHLWVKMGGIFIHHLSAQESVKVLTELTKSFGKET